MSHPLPKGEGKPNPCSNLRGRRFSFRFSADKEFKEKFERLAEVLGIENPEKNMAAIMKRALDVALDKKDPKRKLERRRAKASEKKPCPGKVSSDAPAESRHVASEVQERVHERGSYQCEFCGPDGTRCTSRTGLEIEHIDPFAVFRSHDERRLRLLCRRHNQFQAERFYGVEFIRRKIEERRRKTMSRFSSPSEPAARARRTS